MKERTSTRDWIYKTSFYLFPIKIFIYIQFIIVDENILK